MNQFVRLEMLLGKENMHHLANAHVVIYGIGGVGSFIAESLARSGVGKLTLVDFDTIAESNLNRQIHATTETINASKVETMKERILLFHPECKVVVRSEKYSIENAESFFEEKIDYIADAIDMVSSKLDLICRAKEKEIPIISAMGTGNKLFPEQLEIADLYQTSNCPLARVMRKELKRRGIKNHMVVYSKEKPIRPLQLEKGKLHETPGSTSFVPSTAGLLMASYMVRELIDMTTIERKGEQNVNT
ncbi:ThiF family adenylyltransferase [Gottschalkiaceae bacterium SANA]|nr:ThiF family adenylyltransferase [Gottschalkiaceae bacterium SANA]